MSCLGMWVRAHRWMRPAQAVAIAEWSFTPCSCAQRMKARPCSTSAPNAGTLLQQGCHALRHSGAGLHIYCTAPAHGSLCADAVIAGTSTQPTLDARRTRAHVCAQRIGCHLWLWRLAVVSVFYITNSARCQCNQPPKALALLLAHLLRLSSSCLPAQGWYAAPHPALHHRLVRVPP